MSKATDKTPKCLLTAEQVNRSVTRISHEIVEKNSGADRLAIVGIRTRGEYLARRIREKLKEIENVEVPLGVVDITLYRDDLSHNAEQPLVKGTDLPFDINKVTIVLVDDVLFTGRTVRAALDAIIDFGRPRAIQLAVLCDRGHRELPIRADYVGKNIPTGRRDIVQVHLTDVDDDDGVFIIEREGS